MTAREINIKGLTGKPLRFAQEYVIDWDGRRAAIEAGYAKGSAATTACRLLKNKLVRKYIQAAQQENEARSGLERKTVLEKLNDMFHRDLMDLADGDGFVVDNLAEIPPRAMSYIDGFEVIQHFDDEGNIMSQKIKFKLSPTAQTMDMVMKHIGGYEPELHKHEHTVALDWSTLYGPPTQIVDPATARLAEYQNVIEGQSRRIEERPAKKRRRRNNGS